MFDLTSLRGPHHGRPCGSTLEHRRAGGTRAYTGDGEAVGCIGANDDADTDADTTSTYDFDYERREAMVAMRDGVKLFTVILVPKGAKRAPILLTSTPYNASS